MYAQRLLQVIFWKFSQSTTEIRGIGESEVSRDVQEPREILGSYWKSKRELRWGKHAVVRPSKKFSAVQLLMSEMEEPPPFLTTYIHPTN
jgi:hypothetical protein